MTRYTADQNGQTVVLVIMVTAVLFTMIAALGTTVYHKHNNVEREEKFIQALYAAEAGIETTVARIKKNPSWYNNLPCTGKDFTVFSETPWESRVTFRVTGAKQELKAGTSMVINSVGECTGGNGDVLAKKTLRSEVAVFNAEDYFKGLMVLPGVPGGFNPAGTVHLVADLFVDGDAYSGDNLDVDGCIYASGNISGGQGENKQEHYHYIPPFPELDPAYYLQRALEDGHVFQTDKIWTTPRPYSDGDEEVLWPAARYNGFYFVDGDIAISGDYCGRALFFCTGDINVTGNLEPKHYIGDHVDTGAGGLTLIALGDVDLDNNTVYANIMAGGRLLARGGADLHGAVCARGMVLDGEQSTGGLAVYYDQGLIPVAGAVPVTTKTVWWEEYYPVF